MKPNKFVYVLVFVMFFLFTIPLTQASSVGSTITYTDLSSDKTITEGEDVTIEAYGDSVIYDITKVELILHELDSGDEITIYEETGLSTEFYSLTKEIDKDIYVHTGDYEIEFKVYNPDGATASDSVDLTVEEEEEENTAPDVTINSPDEGDILDTKDISVEFDISDSENNLDYCEYELNSGDKESFDCSKTSLNIEANEGSNTITIYATDTEGETGSDDVSFDVDTEEDDTTKPNLTLDGDNPMTLEVFSDYNEPGYSASDNVDGDLTDDVKITGSVDTSTLGTYNLIYSVTDSAGNTASKERTVEVVDTTKPNLTLKGDNPFEMEINSEYNEPGFSVSDNYDNLNEDDVKVDDSELDTSEEGNYTVYYSVEDSSGNSREKTRTVDVINETTPPEDTTPPEITVVSPEQGESYSGKIRFLVYLDEEGIVNYSLNGEENKSMDKDGNTFTSEMLDLDEEEYEVTFYAEDEAGNKANKTVGFEISKGDDNDNGNTGTGDSDENDICYKRINGHCLTYEDYLYYKQHTSGDGPTIINNSDSDSTEDDKETGINWLKVVFWILLVGVVILFLVLIRYAWKAYYVKNKIE